jgi:hypothetical protein
MSYSNSWLIQQIITGNSPKYNYFLSDRCIQNADWDTHCFNECFVAPFTIDGTTLQYINALDNGTKSSIVL